MQLSSYTDSQEYFILQSLTLGQENWIIKEMTPPVSHYIMILLRNVTDQDVYNSKKNLDIMPGFTIKWSYIPDLKLDSTHFTSATESQKEKEYRR